MKDVKTYISTLMSAVSICMLYDKGHSSVDDFTRRALDLLKGIHEESEVLEIMVVDEDLIVNKKPFRKIGVQGKNFIKNLKRKGISRVDFLKDINFEEMKQMILALSDAKSDLKSSPHIRIGVVDIKTGGSKTDIHINLENLQAFSLEQVQKVQEVFSEISSSKTMNIAGLEEIVSNFIISCKKGANILKLISPIKTYSEYTFTHATNVAVLSIFQAESLGIENDLLREIGIAGLLHDIGKLFIAQEVLEKKGALYPTEWQQIELHPLYGAVYLARLDGITRLAAIAAFEHHMRYDGKGYPALRLNGKKQHLCAQIIAIADFFDALRSRRPYREASEFKEVVYIMKNKSEGMFNPRLADNFVRIIHKAFTE
jgi:HD-GYP domain-containing protein (c-di-GMP phosphodiesterase class II)